MENNKGTGRHISPQSSSGRSGTVKSRKEYGEDLASFAGRSYHTEQSSRSTRRSYSQETENYGYDERGYGEREYETAAAGDGYPQRGSYAPAPEKRESAAKRSSERVQDAPRPKKKKRRRSALRTIGRIFAVLLETVLILAGLLYAGMFLLAKGPSPTASRMFVRSVNETSAIGFLSKLYFTDEEIAEMIKSSGIEEYVPTDTTLINVPAEIPDSTQPDAWGYVDDDGDGLILVPVSGASYNGYMLIVLDPSRVILGCDPSNFYYRGFTVEEFVKRYDAVAGINAGGFLDANGQGNGSMPDGLVAYKGSMYNDSVLRGFAGLDADHILHVGAQNRADAQALNIQYGASYGPVLVQNGEINPAIAGETSLNPRTAIGQRSDGAILMLVIDGRQITSLGASYQEEAEVMVRFGAVNACNMDGGSSTILYFEDHIVNSISLVGIRPVPTTFLVLREGVQ